MSDQTDSIYYSIINELYNESNTLDCGPHYNDKQAFLNIVSPVSSVVPDLKYAVPKEGYHPRIAMAIDFLHQFTLNTNAATIEAQPIVDRAILSNECDRLLRFVRYYFDYTNQDFINPYSGPSRSVNTDDDRNEFLNEIFNYFVTSISVTRARCDIGSATITLKNVRNYRNNTVTTALFNPAISIFYQLLAPMLPIKIWAKGRYYSDYYFPIFDGYIIGISYNDSAGFAEITLSCKDVLEIARITSELINPALIIVAEIQKTNAINVQAQPLYGYDHMDILRKMFCGGQLKYDPNRATALNSKVDAYGNIGKGYTYVPGVGCVPSAQLVSQLSAYNLGKSVLQQFGQLITTVAKTNPTGASSGNSQPPPAVSMEQIEQFDFITNTVPNTADLITVSLEDKGAIRAEALTTKEMLRHVTHRGIIKRKILALGSEITPYRIFNLQTPNIWNSDFSSRLDVIKEVAEMVYYDFFVDGNGTVHYHPFQFSNDFLTYDAVYATPGQTTITKHKDAWPSVQVIGPEEMLNNAPNVNTEAMITFLKLCGKHPTIGDQPAELISLAGMAIHREYLARFGYRRELVENPLFNYNPPLVGDPTDKKSGAICFLDLAAIALIQYKNSELVATTCNIVFRPELEIGRPIFFMEDNSVFYVNGITHTITVGGDATTTINAGFGRKDRDPPVDLNSFMLLQAGMINYGEKNVDLESFFKQLPISQWSQYLDSRQYSMLRLAQTEATTPKAGQYAQTIANLKSQK